MTTYRKVTKDDNGKDRVITVIVSAEEKSAVRDVLDAGNKAFHELTDAQRYIAVELGREESIRWHKSNKNATVRNARNKSINAAAADPTKKAQLEALLGIKL